MPSKKSITQSVSSELNRALFRYYFCYLGLSRRIRRERERSPDEGARETPPDASVVDPDQVGSEIHGPVLQTVLWIRIYMFLGLLDPDPEQLVRGTDTDGSESFNHQAKLVRKTS
jgi:hypothetical protein